MVRKILKISLASVLIIILITMMFVLSVYLGFFGHLPGKKELLHYRNKTASLVLAEEGELIGKFFAQNRTNITYDQIPEHLIHALIATEDARYFQHEGIDARSLLRVIVKSLLFNNRDAGGGSTISQQLVKNMFGRRSYGFLTLPVNKIREALIARRLEKVYSKEEILALYLNTVPFGENVYGIEAASSRYFNKATGMLRIEEAAVLVGMLKANTTYNPHLYPDRSTIRRNVVFGQMAKYGYLGPAEADSLSALPLQVDYANVESRGPAQYFLVRVRHDAARVLEGIREITGRKWNLEEDGLVIRTTLNFKLQTYALQAFREHLSVMQKRLRDQYGSPAGKAVLEEITARELRRLNLAGRAGRMRRQDLFDWSGYTTDSISVADSLRHALTLLHAGLVALEPSTGAIRAWVGGIDFQTQPYDQVIAGRQLASTFKPVLYAAALEKGIRPCHYLDNSPIVIPGPEIWSPSNFDNSVGGNYSVAGALAYSMNIPTVNLLIEVGFDDLKETWEKLGFSFPMEYNPSLALGTAEASVYELASAYSAFANGGFRIDPQAVVSIATADGEIIYENSSFGSYERVISLETSLLMGAMLRKAVAEGTGVAMRSVYGVTLPLAGKTGTSQNFGDAWFAAFNPGIVLAARVGASTTAIHFNHGSDGTGSALALPLVARTLRKVQRDPILKERFSAGFTPLPQELADLLDCPDYREDNLVDKIQDLIQKEKLPSEKGDSKVRKAIKSFFDLFKKKKK